MFVQSPEDVLALCRTWADIAEPVVSFLNAFLNPLGFFIPSANAYCVGVFDTLDQFFDTFTLFPVGTF